MWKTLIYYKPEYIDLANKLQFYRRQEFDYWYRKSTEKLTAEGNDYEG